MRFITDGDVAGALLAVTDDVPIDLLWGFGGTPEGVLSAAAIKCLGGRMLGRFWFRSDDERQAALDAGYDVEKVLTDDDLISGTDCYFSATGVTDGDILEGVRYLRQRFGDDRVAGDGLAVGDGPPDPGHPRPGEARRPPRPGLTPHPGTRPPAPG